MKSLRPRKQVLDCLKEAELILWDKRAKKEIAIDTLIDYIRSVKTKEKFLLSIESIRFERTIDDFLIENNIDNKDIEFYAQHKSEINKDKNKALVFQKKFKIIDLRLFKREFKQRNWYSPIFYDQILRDGIIEDQEYKCAMCEVDISGINPHLHHIDYDKTNCDRKNLIFLCPRCHGKSNSNRSFWNKLLIERQGAYLNF